MKNYGLPYRGSKNKFATRIVEFLPAGETLYDLFCGGGAITHKAMESGKWSSFVMNDINTAQSQLFKNALEGKYKNAYEWVGLQQFNELKNSDAYIASVWSFNSNKRSYFVAKDLEEAYEAMHKTIVEPTSKKRFAYFRKLARILKQNPELLDNMIRNPVIERIARYESLFDEGFDSTKVKTFGLDYKDVPLTEPGVIYCDIPYSQTESYKHDDGVKRKFNFEEFYDWCAKQTLPVYISESDMPLDRFDCVAIIGQRVSAFGGQVSTKTEKLWIPKHQSK